MHIRGLAALACTGLLVTTACGNAAETSSATAAHLEADGVRMADPVSDAPYSELADGNRQLGHDLATTIPTSDGNLVFSPASLSIAFAMLREGARGDTAAEIDRVLHLPANRSAAYNGLLHQVSDVGHDTVLEVNDGLFLDPRLTVQSTYLKALKKWYGAGVEQTAFPHPALEVINGWVDDNTHGRIPRLLDRLDRQDVFALVNTIYLNAKWREPFDAEQTTRDPFTTADGERTSVETLHQAAVWDYAETASWKAVRLPYRGGDLSMVVLLPAGNGSPIDLLAPDVLAAADAGFLEQPVDLALPKWDLATTAKLTEILKRLGMTSTFRGGDFSALTPDGSFEVSQVVQQANITVGEKGTEAAAATAIVGRTSAMPPAQDAVSFVADHPFAFAIVHDSTGVPLFEGVVANPS